MHMYNCIYTFYNNFIYIHRMFRSMPKAAVIGTLSVRNVTLADAGNYTCRVDFYTAQTAMTLLTLNVYGESQPLW